MTQCYRILIKSLIATLAIGLIFFAGRYALANLYANYVENSLADWQGLRDEQALIDEHGLKSVLNAAKQANALHPDHPHYLVLEAKVYQWLYLTSAKQPKVERLQHAEPLLSSLTLLEQAVALRPHWPNTYADLVQTKLWLNQIDDEFALAFALADQYGPMTAEVHLVLSQAGLLAWRELSTPLRQLTNKHIALGLLHKQSQSALIGYLGRLNRLAYGCALARQKVKRDEHFPSVLLPSRCRRN
ncbi:VpsP family polysaccharide biosynthesis protein [Motilimonas eburnea]|uniref:VpsP family polysaccharide biosynthesis protein n=1 Tax=Motilimonas eburnea TaxID=1737488 RepID=UPI001E53EA4F|nr:VpsP family polysaccharide biosynthesis protein [Motilimonas eburnea]MCE2570630.1 VpsP family polysaccharide biosynthesis protein [Motilimonas eburnea]